MARLNPRGLLERIGLPFLYAALVLVRLYRPTFHRTSEYLYRAADRLGVYPVIDHYHDPPVRPDPGPPRRRSLPGIDLGVDRQLALLHELRSQAELREIGLHDDGTFAPYYRNPSFASPDAGAYYSLLRHVRPARVVEVGSGQSTRFAARALAANAMDGTVGELVAIEPYEAPELERFGVTVVRRRIEDAAERLEQLRSGDVLFVDSSHVVRPGGDVALLLLEIVPALPPGVLVHVHDVFTPGDYPAEWGRRRWFWGEQYVVEALLTHNPRLEVVLAVSFLLTQHREAFAAAVPVPDPVERGPTPGSLWLRTL